MFRTNRTRGRSHASEPPRAVEGEEHRRDLLDDRQGPDPAEVEDGPLAAGLVEEFHPLPAPLDEMAAIPAPGGVVAFLAEGVDAVAALDVLATDPQSLGLPPVPILVGRRKDDLPVVEGGLRGDVLLRELAVPAAEVAGARDSAACHPKVPLGPPLLVYVKTRRPSNGFAG